MIQNQSQPSWIEESHLHFIMEYTSSVLVLFNRMEWMFDTKSARLHVLKQINHPESNYLSNFICFVWTYEIFLVGRRVQVISPSPNILCFNLCIPNLFICIVLKEHFSGKFMRTSGTCNNFWPAGCTGQPG